VRRISVLVLLLTLILVVFGCGGWSAPQSSTTASPSSPSSPVTPSFSKDEPDFTIVTLPDTQYYAHFVPYRPTFKAQTDWIIANKQGLNVVGVLGLGDTVDCGNSDAVQWGIADAAYSEFDGTGIPYVPIVGNHDISVDCRGIAPPRDGTSFNTHFGPSRFQKYSWYGSSTYPAGSNENYYVKIDLKVRKFLVVALEFRPRPEAISWASSVIESFPDREVIIITHAYLNPDGTWAGEGSDLWNALVKKFPNVVMATCGHMHGVSHRTDTGDKGNTVHSILSDYQAEPNGGNGWLRVMKFRPAAGVIEVQTYSPTLNQYDHSADNEFTLTYK